MATNEVQFSCTWDFSKGVVCQLRVSGVADAELSSLLRSHVAAFVPESKVCVSQFNSYRGGLVQFFANKSMNGNLVLDNLACCLLGF